MTTLSKPRRTSIKTVNDNEIDVIKILADPYPTNVDDYAIQLYYRANRTNPNFKVNSKKVIDNATAELVIDGSKKVLVNIQTGDINETSN